MKIPFIFIVVAFLSVNHSRAVAREITFSQSNAEAKADCEIITRGETLVPDKGCVFDYCFDDPNHPGKEAGCSQVCPGDPGFPAPSDIPPEPKPPKEPEPEAPEPAPQPEPEPQAPEPTPEPEPQAPEPAPVPEPDPSSPDGGVPSSPEAPPETPGTDGGDFECTDNTNCLSPDSIEGPVTLKPGITNPGGSKSGKLDCLDPKAHCLPVGGVVKNGSAFFIVKPITRKDGKLDCSNPSVICVRNEPKGEKPGFAKGCSDTKLNPQRDGIPSLKETLANQDALFCKQNPLSIKCLNERESSPERVFCKKNPFSFRCLKPASPGIPVIKGLVRSGQRLGNSPSASICRNSRNLPQCE